MKPVGERAGAAGQGGLEARETQLRERDVLIGDGLAEREPARPLESLRNGHRPSGAFAGECACRIGDALAAKFQGELGVFPRAGGLATGFGGVEFGLVEGNLGVLGGDFTNERGYGYGRGDFGGRTLGACDAREGEEHQPDGRADKIAGRGNNGLHER